ncbi:hypothetical protein AUC68_04750 [Methyloceanibacter methanicus]|uniref:Uncharacterized protein n=1 Tax=Methyloceanibacter methanicus TaxID=1774968 RepID=A0A1E3W0I3_9HYPH|nr:hypothetical protein [Methyloceanibacter methanicus]ODR99307.1 hypothetical protein AUC68_04750 [Methyloceanibacter methanicus]
MATNTKKSKKSKNQPVEKMRNGSIVATIWKNESEKGAFFSVTFARTYKDADGDYHDVNSFSGTQLLQLAKLANEADTRVRKLRQDERATDDDEDDQEEAA